jgi:hypothetical protein
VVSCHETGVLRAEISKMLRTILMTVTHRDSEMLILSLLCTPHFNLCILQFDKQPNHDYLIMDMGWGIKRYQSKD